MKRKKLLELAERLEAWADNPAKDAHGICYLICLNYKLDGEKWAQKTMPKWPEHSGISEFPVPAPEGFQGSAVEAFYTLPLWTGEYGESRRQLCTWLAEQARKEASR